MDLQIVFKVDPITGLHMGQEDCLRLNVFSPNIKPIELLPVLVYIHGGGFTLGEATTVFVGPQFLVDEDLLVVTFHYRLGYILLFVKKNKKN